MAAVFAFGAITLVFAILERYPHASTFAWNPRRLPRVPPLKTAAARRPASRFTAVVEVLACTLAGLLWIDVAWFPPAYTSHGVEITLSPIWLSFFWPILLVTLGRAAEGLIAWLRPWWMRTRLSVRLAVDAVTLVLLGALGDMGALLRLSAPNLPARSVADANYWANAGLSIGIGVAFIITLVRAVREARSLIRQKPAHGAERAVSPIGRFQA
jgi:hypothetical protein